MSEELELLTVDEAAKFLRVPKSWIYQRTRTGEIPFFKLSGHCRFSRQQLREYVARHQVPAAA